MKQTYNNHQSPHIVPNFKNSKLQKFNCKKSFTFSTRTYLNLKAWMK